jgi:hypothetical protein
VRGLKSFFKLNFMSLTSFVRNGLGTKIYEMIPPPRDCPKNIPLLAPPQNNHLSIVGTAFDYLLRAYIKHFHHAQEDVLVGVRSLEILKNCVKNGACKFGGRTIDAKTIRYLEGFVGRVLKEREAFIRTGELDLFFFEDLIRFSRLDTVYRAGTYYDPRAPVPEEEVIDLYNLFQAIPRFYFQYPKRWILDVDFSKYIQDPKVKALFQDRADADLLRWDALIDIKTVHECEITKYYWGQIVGYLVLAQISHEHGSFPEIKEAGFYFARHGYVWTFPAEYVYKHKNYPEVRNLLVTKFYEEFLE